MLLMLIVAAVGKLGPTSLKFCGLLVLLGILQAILGMISESTPAIGPLHTINALAIYAVSALLAHKTWTQDRSSQPAAASA